MSFRLVAALLPLVAALAALPARAADDPPPLRIVALGDSLTAGYGLAAEDGFPAQLERALRDKGYNVVVVDAGVSGDTMSGGLSRLDWSVPGDSDAVILELGANDALRGIDPAVTTKALDAILDRLVTQRSLPVLIAGMRAPPNLGEAYAAAFDPMFAEAAKRYDALYYPFFLDGVVGNAALNLADGLHPTGPGIAVIVERILPSVEALIERAKTGRS